MAFRGRKLLGGMVLQVREPERGAVHTCKGRAPLYLLRDLQQSMRCCCRTWGLLGSCCALTAVKKLDTHMLTRGSGRS